MIEQTFATERLKAAETLSPRAALLVEDDTLVAMVVEEGLLSLGFEPHLAMDAAAAVAAMADGLGAELAVIDVGLPDERGDQLARRLRGLYPHLKIIIASGYDEATLSAQFADDDSITVLGKPYTESDLGAAVRRLGLTTTVD
jgi:CheY-like chemotaxis protein